MPNVNFQVVFNDKLREISTEVSEFIDNDPNHPESGKRMVSKSEALCRSLFKMALGWEENRETKEGNITKVVHNPEKWAIREIMDRVDGRTIAAVAVEDNTASIADHIRDAAKNLLNDMAKETDGS